MPTTNGHRKRLALVGLFAIIALVGAVVDATASEARTQLKPPIQGLVNRQGFPPTQYDAIVHAFVANLHWSDIQTSPDGPIIRNNALDQALAQARAYNSANPGLPQMHVKLRLMAGIWAPDWAKTMHGFNPVAIQSLQAGNSAQGTVGPFWRADYAEAYTDLQAKLAAIYDHNVLLNDVTVSQCMTI